MHLVVEPIISDRISKCPIVGDATRNHDGECLYIGWTNKDTFVIRAGGTNYTAEFPIPRKSIVLGITIADAGRYISVNVMEEVGNI